MRIADPENPVHPVKSSAVPIAGAAMTLYSIYGTGMLIYGIEQDLDRRVECTVWFCVFWIPLVPISSWQGRYEGAEDVEGFHKERLAPANLVRIPHHGPRILGTFLSGMCCAALAVSPITYLLVRTEGRAATTVEVVLVFVALGWCMGLIFFVGHQRRKKLELR